MGGGGGRGEVEARGKGNEWDENVMGEGNTIKKRVGKAEQLG